MKYFEHKRILVPFDFSELAENAVETAVKIAGNCENVTVLHVVHPAPMYLYTNADSELAGPFDMGEPAGDNAAELDNEHEQRALQMLQGQFGDARHVGLRFATAVDDAPHGIADFASINEFDLIVMPSHGRTGVKRLLIGSVAERMNHIDDFSVTRDDRDSAGSLGIRRVIDHLEFL